jgi:transcriptional regulator with XRE-family HTH domain
MKNGNIARLKVGDSINVNDFWYRVNKIIKEKRITQEYLASKIGVNYPTLRGWSHRKYIPSINHIHAIAQVLETSINFLVLGEDKIVNKKSHIIGETLLQLIKLIKDEI